jgi:hypothetical protein
MTAVILMQDNGFVEKAARDHERALSETKELYARHSLGFEAPTGSGRETGKAAMTGLAEEIIDESKVRFDLVRDGNGFTSNSPFIRITGKEGAGHAVLVDVPNGQSARLNFLLVCGEMNLPLELAVNVGDGARLDLFEWYGSVSRGKTLVAPLHSINAGKESSSEISLLHNENGNASVGAVGRISAQEEASVRFNSLYNGGSVTKSALFADASGWGSRIDVNEVVFGNSGQTFDLSNYLLNSGERTATSLRSGSALRGGSRCIMKGYAKVAKGARGSSSAVEQRGLILDPASRAQLLPDMSVECRDAESASHSASVAPIDPDALFYLMSRGMGRERARRAFLASFVSKHLSGIGSDTVKEIAISMFLDKFDSDRLCGAPGINTKDFWVVPETRSEDHEA